MIQAVLGAVFSQVSLGSSYFYSCVPSRAEVTDSALGELRGFQGWE